jgi:hypothetical protein
MELLGDVRHVEPHFGPFRDRVSVYERKDRGLRPMYHKPEKSFWTHMMELLGESRFHKFGDSVSAGLYGDNANLDTR